MAIHTKGEYCCDFETTSKAQYLRDGYTKIYLYRMVDLKSGKKVDMGINIESFINSLKINKDITKVYFHNLSFDGTFIIDHLLRVNYKWLENEKFKEETKSSTNNLFTSIIDNFGSIYQIEIYFGENKKKVVINCSYKLTGLSIKELGNLVGVNKLNETHDYTEMKDYKTLEEVTEEEISYITNDVEIMRLGIIKCYEMGIRGITKASACYKLWKNMSWQKWKNDIKTDYDERTKQIVDDSYKGAITIMNPLYANKIIEGAIDYDVNSLYPSQMLYGEMPIGEYQTANNDEEINQSYNVRLYEIAVIEATILKGYIPFIGVQKSLVFKESYEYKNTIKFMTLYLWDKEFELFKTFYTGEWQITKVVAWRGEKNLFKEYIEKFKKIKEEAPNPSPERAFAKLCMNSVYGKFAQTSERLSKAPFINDKDEVGFKVYKSESKSSYDRKIASRITSLARCVLIQAIESNKDRFLYCDTDSIYLKGKEEAQNIPIDDKKLGCWKMEHTYSKFKGLKAKCYISTIDSGKEKGQLHSAVAGLPKDAQQNLTYENFKNGLIIKDAKKRLYRVKGGIIIDTCPFTIKIANNEVLGGYQCC